VALARTRLATAGVPEPELDAELLLRHVLGWDRAQLLTRGGSPLDVEAEARYVSLLGQRAARRPIQHLTGVQAFWRHEFRVGPAVLIPRPETETLVEACLEELRERAAPRVVDVGTGSGCIAICLALERPDAEVLAVDVSDAALEQARDNAGRLGAGGRVAFQQRDLLAGLEGPFDLVASNPPYVDASEIGRLEPEVREHEPRLALVPPSGDRYAVYRALAPQAAGRLAAAGSLVLEVGVGMHAEVARICEDAGLRVARLAADLQGIPRILVARRPGWRPAVNPT
jgi:release factor glutamine methyltransferase